MENNIINELSEVLTSLVDTSNLISDNILELGGMTNNNYLVNVDNKSLVVRLSNTCISKFIDRKSEILNTLCLESNDTMKNHILHSKLLTNDGHKVSEFIECSSLDINNPELMSLAISKLKLLHNSNIKFKDTRTPFTLYHEYKSLIKNKRKLSKLYNLIKEDEINRLEIMYNNLDVNYKPCHFDTVAENFLCLGNGDILLNDFEYSCMSDPVWDLVQLCSESGILDNNSILKLISHYGLVIDKEIQFRAKVCNIMNSITWYLWSILAELENTSISTYKDIKFNQLESKLEHYNFNNAIILASGLGSRLRPYTNSIPKSLLLVDGLPIVEHTIKHLLDSGIEDIKIVVGYLANSFSYLVEKYPTVSLIENLEYSTKNNVNSVSLATNYIHGTYIIDGDVYIKNNVFKCEPIDYSFYFIQPRLNNLGEWLLLTNEFDQVVDYNVVSNPNDELVHASMSYWSQKDCYKLINVLGSISEINKSNLKYVWDHFVIKSNSIEIYTKKLSINDTTEIDTVDEYEAIMGDSLCQG